MIILNDSKKIKVFFLSILIYRKNTQKTQNLAYLLTKKIYTSNTITHKHPLLSTPIGPSSVHISLAVIYHLVLSKPILGVRRRAKWERKSYIPDQWRGDTLLLINKDPSLAEKQRPLKIRETPELEEINKTETSLSALSLWLVFSPSLSWI